jgi:ribosomal protein S3AE
MDLNMAVEWECYFRDKLRNHALQHNALFQRLASVINPVPLVETQDDYEVRVLGNEWTVEKKKATNRRLIRL